MKYLLPEIFDQVQKAATVEERVAILRKNQSPTLLDILRLNFDPRIKINLPEGEPPFKKDKNLPIGYGDSNLYTESRRLYLWVQPSNVSKVKLETLFIQMLEGLHHSEAELLCAVKDRKLTDKWPNLNEALIRQTWNDFLPAESVVPVVTEVVAEAPVKRRPGRPKKVKL